MEEHMSVTEEIRRLKNLFTDKVNKCLVICKNKWYNRVRQIK